MGISIRDPEVGELARELANLRKTNMTEAIAHALRSGAEARTRKAAIGERLAELAARERERRRARMPREVTKEEIDATVGPVTVFVDTSVIVAFILDERGASALVGQLEARTAD